MLRSPLRENACFAALLLSMPIPFPPITASRAAASVQLVLKVYHKREPISLGAVQYKLEGIRATFAEHSCPNLMAFVKVVETERAGYILRQVRDT